MKKSITELAIDYLKLHENEEFLPEEIKFRANIGAYESTIGRKLRAAAKDFASWELQTRLKDSTAPSLIGVRKSSRPRVGNRPLATYYWG